MRTNKEIQKRINELAPKLELAEESYFSTIEEKQGGEYVYEADFIKIESEYETLKKEINVLRWVLEIEE